MAIEFTKHLLILALLFYSINFTTSTSISNQDVDLFQGFYEIAESIA